MGSAINITATMSEAVVAGSSSVTLAGASDEVVLTAAAGTTLRGHILYRRVTAARI